MENFRSLQKRNEALLKADELGQDVIADADNYIGATIKASSDIVNSLQRDQLRSNLRYWANYIYEKTGRFPKTELLSPTVRAITRERRINYLRLISIIIISIIGIGLLFLPVLISINSSFEMHLKPSSTPVAKTPKPTGMLTSTFFPSLTYTVAPSPTFYFITSTVTIIPTITPTSWLKPTLSTDIIVGPWHDNSPNCNPNSSVSSPLYQYISIFGVEIYGSGKPPFRIVFSQNSRVLAIITTTIGKLIEFTNPVIVEKGYPVNVSITFFQGGQQFIWDNDLLYIPDQFNPLCSK